LSVTYGQNDNYTFTVARWQIVVKRSEATKQTQNETKNNQQETTTTTTTTAKQAEGGGG